MSLIYTLKLKEDKWYVGRLDKGYDLDKRMALYAAGGGAKWVQKYIFDMMVSAVPATDDFAEITTTLKLMKQHGIDSVRGGPWNSERPIKHTQVGQHVQRMIESAYNCCHLCGQEGHYSYFCESTRTKQLLI